MSNKNREMITELPFDLPYISGPNEIPNDDYHNGEQYEKFISSTELKRMITSPKFFKWCQDHPNDTRTISLESELKGSVYHDLLASKVNHGNYSGFERDWCVFSPPINDRTGQPFGYSTKAFTDAYDAFQAINIGRQICSQAEVDLAKTMIKEMVEGNSPLSKDVRFFIKNGQAEQSHFVEYKDPETGYVGYFKYRTDLKTVTKMFDWKSCGFEDPKLENWSRHVVKYGYHISAAFYQFFEHVRTGVWKPFYWIVQEKEPPYDFNIIDAGNWAYDVEITTQIVEKKIGGQIVDELIKALLRCSHTGEWGGYWLFTMPDWKGHRIGRAPVPGYEKNNLIHFNF